MYITQDILNKDKLFIQLNTPPIPMGTPHVEVGIDGETFYVKVAGEEVFSKDLSSKNETSEEESEI